MIKKMIFLLALMMILSYLGQVLSARFYSFELQSFYFTMDLIRKNSVFILFTQMALYLLDMIRLKCIGAALKIKFSLKETFGAVSLNLLFGWLSPAAVLGAPAMAYYLHKRGHPLRESICIAFVRSFSIITVSAISTIFITTFKLQGHVINVVLQEKTFQVLELIALYMTILVFFSFYPIPILKKFKSIEIVTFQIKDFLTEGKVFLVPILFLTLLMNIILVSFLPYRMAPIYPELTPLIAQSLLFLSFMLLMPTPGASGFAEIGAPLFFQGAVSKAEILSNVSAMRVSTISLQVAVGLLFMIFMMREKFTLKELKKFQNKN
jgi:uncharacterized membrane protein YbhN (UPF0104 family)